MELKGILHVGGKPGLYKLIAQSKNGVIVESLDGKKRMPVSSSASVSSLEDIAMYTLSEEKPLHEVFLAQAKMQEAKPSINHKESEATLRAKFKEVLPDYDQERVYVSDIRKFFQWYNILVEHKIITQESLKEKEEEGAPAEEANEAKKAKTKDTKEAKPAKAEKPKTAAKKQAAPKTAAKKTSVKKAPPKAK